MGSPRRWAQELLHVWFAKLQPTDWFSSCPDVDSMLRKRFADDRAAMSARPADTFLTDPHTALAAILLFDQVSRNLFRDDPRAYATDGLARAVARGMVARRWARLMGASQRAFVGMPFMHSEHIADQLFGLRYFAAEGLWQEWRFARSHYRMIARFGRFPHRNAVLGRRSSAAERRAIEAGFNW